ncbi:MAG TPA: hypothetical protein RMH80_17635 [Polyangiaceae bacterium LLY-WYZ-15_(1-7)]|nr:hypothetical protein [Polyangiaceae bacterium LLY-WYZ-15_(1-7)]
MSAPPRVDPPRVDVAVPGSEGTWLVRALAEAGFDAHHAPTLAASTDADVIVAEASLEDFPERARPLAGRLFVIGWEPLDDATREALADPPFQRRPVAIADLVRALREQTGWEGEAPPASPSKAPPPVRERTMQLDLDDEEPAAFGPEPTLALADSTGVHPRPDAEPPRSEPPPPPTPVPPRPSSQATTARAEEDARADAEARPPTTSVPTGVTAELSPRLVGMLREADRRLFPEEPALDLRFPGGDEPAHVLVPDELLAEVAMPLDPLEPDPLEAFTFVGAPDLLAVTASALETSGQDGKSAGGSSSRSQIVSTSGGSRTPRTVDERGDGELRTGSTAGGASDLTREGMLPAGGVLRVLWQIHGRSRPTELVIELAGGPRVVLSVRGGALVDLDGPVLLRVARALRQEGRVKAAAEDEASARELLDDAVRRDLLDPFERAQRLRRAREALVHELVLAEEAAFVVRDAPRELPARPLIAGPLLQVATEGARRRLRRRRALRWLGVDADARLVPTPELDAHATALGLEPELVEAIEAAAEGPLAQLLYGLPASAGIAGALFALASTSAIRFVGRTTAGDVSISAVRRRVLELHRRAEEGTYFDVLELSPRAGAREIAEEHRRLCRELDGLDLRGLGLEDLEDLRQEILVALDEARDVLSDARLRAAYAASL